MASPSPDLVTELVISRRAYLPPSLAAEIVILRRRLSPRHRRASQLSSTYDGGAYLLSIAGTRH